MRLHKTLLARETLTSQNLALSQAERRVLILCDGQRDRTTVEKMLGEGASATINVLIAQGYLSNEANVAATTSPAPAPALRERLAGVGKLFQRETPAPTPAAPAPVATREAEPAPAPAPVAAKPSVSRRSLAACKMYILDMLQLQKNMDASALAVDIQTTSCPHQMVEHMLHALRHLRDVTKPSISERIAQRLLETMPELHLPRLQVELELLFSAPDTTLAGNVVPMRREVVA